MANPAARLGDDHKCPMVDPGPKPHVGGPIQPPCYPLCTANSIAMARATDRATCQGPPDFIVTGSATVQIGGKAAARLSDKTMHDGTITAGSTNVMIGGATIGSTLGNPVAGLAAFNAAAKGRVSGSTQQSAQNCGIESSRQIINQATGNAVREKPLLNRAIKNKWAEAGATWRDSGGTTPAKMRALLSDQGVTATLGPQKMADIQQAVAEGKGVITAHQAGRLWNTSQQGGHAVLVTGIKYDANGLPKTVYINDTGTGQGMNPVPASRFEKSLLPGFRATITSNKIW